MTVEEFIGYLRMSNLEVVSVLDLLHILISLFFYFQRSRGYKNAEKKL